MALIDQHHRFDVDMLTGAVIGIAAELGVHDSGMHSHQRAQLLYAPKGCMTITLDAMRSILPPTKAAFIPAGTQHRVEMVNVVSYRSVYLEPSICAALPTDIKILSVNPLLQALIEKVAFWPFELSAARQKNTVALLVEELVEAQEHALLLPLPTDPRLARWLMELTSHGDLPQPLNQIKHRIGASERTISRIFIKETGMAYSVWRQQWRLHHAIALLAQGVRVNQVARELEFASDSAFIAFFKQYLDLPPWQFFRQSKSALAE